MLSSLRTLQRIGPRRVGGRLGRMPHASRRCVGVPVCRRFMNSEANPAEPPRFADMGLSDRLVERLAARGFVTAFPVQAETLPVIQAGKDIIVRAKTGSGKTMAFALPVLDDLASRPAEDRRPRALIVAPTRELANQVSQEFVSVTPGLSVVVVHGGVAIGPQIAALQRGCEVVVGTPGRLLDLIERNCLALSAIEWFILDEADHMLDKGFDEDVASIASHVPLERRTMLFSATIPKWVSSIASRYMKQPAYVDLISHEDSQAPREVRHVAIRVNPEALANTTDDILSTYVQDKAIIFTQTRAEADELVAHTFLRRDGAAIHGALTQARRDDVLDAFKRGDIRVLVATDVAARGLDIPNVDTVIQLAPPDNVESYLHRSGRCGRAGNKGTSVVLWSHDKFRVTQLEERLGLAFEHEPVPSPDDVVQAQCNRAIDRLSKWPVLPGSPFVAMAEKLVAEGKGTQLLAHALAYAGGSSGECAARSALTGRAGRVALTATAANGMAVAEQVESFLTLLLGEVPNPRLDRVTHWNRTLLADVSTSVADALEAALATHFSTAQVKVALVRNPADLPWQQLEVHTRRTQSNSGRNRGRGNRGGDGDRGGGGYGGGRGGGGYGRGGGGGGYGGGGGGRGGGGRGGGGGGGRGGYGGGGYGGGGRGGSRGGGDRQPSWGRGRDRQQKGNRSTTWTPQAPEGGVL